MELITATEALSYSQSIIFLCFHTISTWFSPSFSQWNTHNHFQFDAWSELIFAQMKSKFLIFSK